MQLGSQLTRLSNARFPPFRFRSSVAVSPFPLAVAVSVRRCRCRCRCRCVAYNGICLKSVSMCSYIVFFQLTINEHIISIPSLVGVDDWLASYGTTEKIELDPISTEERLRQLFSVYGCNGTEISYVILQNNGILNR